MTFLLRRLAGGAAAFALFSFAASVRADPPPSDITLAPPVDVAPSSATTQNKNAALPAIATNGTDSLICWSESTFAARVACGRYTGAGATLDPDTIVLDGSLGSGSRPLVAWDGARYVVFEGNTGQHLDAVTGALDAPFTIPPANGAPAAAGGGFTLAIHGTTATVYDVGFNPVGHVTIPAQLAQGASFHGLAAFSSGTFLVIWVTPTWQVLGVRISTSAALLDSAPIAIDPGNPYPGSDGGTNYFMTSLTVGGSGNGFFVAWGDPRHATTYNTYGTPVGLDGSVVSPGGALIALEVSPASIAGAGATYWIGASPSAGNTASITSVSASGVVGSTVIATTDVRNPSFAVASTSATTFFAWTKKTGTWGGSDVTAIEAERVDSSGYVLDVQPAWLSTSLVRASNLQIASTANGYFVTWYEYDATYGSRLARDGTPIDAQPLRLMKGYATTSAMSDSYVVVGNSYILELPRTGPPETYFAGPNTSLQNLLCATHHCFVQWPGAGGPRAEILGIGGTTTAPFALPGGSVLATDGASFLLVNSETTDGGAAQTVARIIGSGGAVGSAIPLPPDYSYVWPGPAAWGVDRYLVLRGGRGILRLAADGSPLEPETTIALGNAENQSLVWDGRAFLVAGVPVPEPATPSPLAYAVEVPASGPASLANQFTPFDAPAEMVVVASSTPGEVLAAALLPRGGSKTPRPVTRRITLALAAVAGDAGNNEAGAEDAGIADGGARDANAGDAKDGGAIDGSIDASALADASDGGGQPVARNIEDASGCGCRNASADPSGGLAAIVAWLSAIALVLTRRRTANRISASR